MPPRSAEGASHRAVPAAPLDHFPSLSKLQSFKMQYKLAAGLSFLLENLAVPACVRSTAQSLLINWKFGGSGARKSLSAFVRRNKEVSGQWFATEENRV